EDGIRDRTVTGVQTCALPISLSMDNVFIIALIFAYFRLPQQFQHRVLFWGILGALIMRGVMIALGVTLIHRFTFMFYLLGVFLRSEERRVGKECSMWSGTSGA